MKRSVWRFLFISEEIRNRLLFSLGLLILYRLAAHVPVPGVNRAAIASILNQSGGGALINLLDLLSGGTVSNFSVLAMGVYPYITAQIILQLLVPIIPALQQRVEDDPKAGREFMERWTYYLSVPMSILSAIGQIRLFNSQSFTVIQNFGFNWGDRPELAIPTITTLVTMGAGTMFAIWLGELISEYGIRNQGLSLIIFSGIVARIPANLYRTITDQQNRGVLLISYVAITVATIFAIVIVQQGRRNVPVMYPGRRMGNRQSMPVRGTLPLLVNMAGMIPLIFAQSILTFPAIIASLFAANANPTVQQIANSLITFFNGNGGGYAVMYFLMVVAFTFFYTDVLFQQQNYGENLKRVGAQVPGVARGAPTQKYLTRVLHRITFPGAVFLGLVAVLPFVVGMIFGQGPSLLINSAGLLIVVGVVRDTFFGLETELKLRGYDDTLLVR
jgi:preprotein translocase subunit SecY